MFLIIIIIHCCIFIFKLVFLVVAVFFFFLLFTFTTLYLYEDKEYPMACIRMKCLALAHISWSFSMLRMKKEIPAGIVP